MFVKLKSKAQTEEDRRVEKMVALVEHANHTLAVETDKSPRNPKINDALSGLVQGIMEGYQPREEQRVLQDTRVSGVRSGMLKNLAIAEGEMEKYWAEHFCERDSLTVEDFKEFMYWNCYDRLVNGEITKLPNITPQKGESIAFVGAGPLPLTALILHLKTGMKVTCIDVDPRACELAEELFKKAGLEDQFTVECTDGASHDFEHNPIVFIASLVPNKGEVIKKIREASSETFIGVRSAERLHVLLYEPIDEVELEEAGCLFSGRTTHDPKTINTTLFYNLDPALLHNHDLKMGFVKSAEKARERKQEHRPGLY